MKEEEQDLFPKVEEAFGDEKLKELAKQMKVRFEEVLSAGFVAFVPKGFSKTSADTSMKSKLRAAAA